MLFAALMGCIGEGGGGGGQHMPDMNFVTCVELGDTVTVQQKLPCPVGGLAEYNDRCKYALYPYVPSSLGSGWSYLGVSPSFVEFDEGTSQTISVNLTALDGPTTVQLRYQLLNCRTFPNCDSSDGLLRSVNILNSCP